MDPAVPIPDAGLASLPDTLFKAGLPGSPRLVVVGRRINEKHGTGLRIDPFRSKQASLRLQTGLSAFGD
jgi:hypothetical protein